MKVGILTHHKIPNFGANLQALATFNLLLQLGHQVEVLDYEPPGMRDRYRSSGVSEPQFQAHEDFCRHYIRTSPRLDNEVMLANYASERGLDTVVAGSDAIFRLNVWGTGPEGGFPNPYWLVWAKDCGCRTAVLAGSCMGSAYYVFPRELRRRLGLAVRSFDFLSVRDRWTRWMFMLVTHGRARAPICPDPMSILNDVFDVPQTNRSPHKLAKGRYVLLSVEQQALAPAWVDEFVDLAHARRFKVIGLPVPEMEMPYDLDSQIRLPLSPLEWYAWIKSSSGFIGSRFHPIVCCIFNHVPFVSIDSYWKRGIRGHFRFVRIGIFSKTYDLCKSAGTLNRIVSADRANKLSPSEAMRLLEEKETPTTAGYVANAKREFRRVATGALGNARVNQRQLSLMGT